MGDSSQEVTPQQEVGTESVKRSEMCIGFNGVMTLPENTVTGVTIMIAQPVTHPNFKRTELVTNITLHETQCVNCIEPLTFA